MESAVTYLFVPADRPERFAKALASGADRAIIDLEDGVRAEDRPAARQAIRDADLDWSRVAIRVNGPTTPDHDDDLATVAAIEAAAVVVPKSESRAALEAARAAVGREIELIPQIESAVGLANLAAVLAAPGVRRVAFGHLDYSLDLGCAPDWESLTLVRQQLVLQSRIGGAEPPIDSITGEFDDPEVVRREAHAARRLGFGAKLLIHPAQVPITAEAFAPSAEERDWAERVLAALAEGPHGAISLDGQMIDKPLEDAARRVLARVASTSSGD